MIGIEGVRLDILEKSISPLPEDSSSGMGSRFSENSERVGNFKDAFERKIMAGMYPTGEDPNVAFARCLVFDNRLIDTWISLGRSLLGPDRIFQMWNEYYEPYEPPRDHTTSSDADVPDLSPHLENSAQRFTMSYTTAIFDTTKDRALIMTSSGYIGLGAPCAKAGDTICVLNGSPVPSVLRKVLHDDSIYNGHADQKNVARWKLVGNCYLHGFMDNEATSAEWQAKKEMLWIV